MLDVNTFQELEELIPDVLMAKQVPFIQGKPGVGKSTFWKKIADKMELEFIDIRLSTFDPTFFNGFLWWDDKTNKAVFKPLDVFPLKGDKLNKNPATGKDYKGFLVHLDEFTQAPKSVEGAAYKLVLDRYVGERKLHSDCFVVASGNPSGQGMIAKPISTPMRSRVIHFEMENTLKSFTPAMIELGFHPVIINYLTSAPEMLNNFNDAAGNPGGTYACERTWEKLSDIIYQLEKPGEDGIPRKVGAKHLPVMRGTVGEAAGNGMLSFLENYYACPDINVIIQNPEGTMLPDNIQEQYASIAYLVAHTTISNGKNLGTYLKRFPEEFQLIFGRVLLGKDEPAFDANFEFLTELVAEYAI